MSDVARSAGDAKRLPSQRVFWSTYGAKVAVVGISFLIGVLSARSLGPAGLGTYAVAMVSAGVLVQIANFGFSSAILYFVSKRPRRAGQTVVFAWAMGGVLCGVGFLLLEAFPVLERFGGHLVVLWAAVQLALLLQDSAYLGIRQFGARNGLQVVGRTVSLLAAGAAAVLRPGQAQSFIAYLIGADTVMLVIGGLLLHRYTVVRLPSKRFLWPFTRLGARAFPVLLLPFLLIRSDILLMRYLRGVAETGVYSIAAQLTDFVLLFPAMFSAVLFVSLSDSKTRVQDTLAVWRWVLRMLLLSAVGLLLVGWWAIPFVFGPEFGSAYWPMLILLPGALALGLETVIVQYFARQGYPPFVSGALLLALLANIAVNLATIPRFGAIGAAFGSTMAYTLASLLVVRRFLMETGVSFQELWHAPPPDMRGAEAAGE